MSFIRTKNIKGHEYYYEVETIRRPEGPRQRHIRYIGKTLDSISGLSNLSDNILNRENLRDVPNDKPGVYYFYNKDKKLIYIGRAGDNHGFGLRHRISAHYQKDASRPEWEQSLSRNAYYFFYKPIQSDNAARKIEDEEIKIYQPKYNNYQKT